MPIRTNPAAPGLPRGATQPQIEDAINRILAGGLNCVLSVTLTPGDVSTTIIDNRIGPKSSFGFMALTDSAQTAQLAGLKVTNRLNGSAIIHHANAVATDQDFTMTILGA